MSDDILHLTVAAFNDRRYEEASILAQKALADASGKDELFWLGVYETCLGFSLVMNNNLSEAERNLVAAMEKLRNFGFRRQDLEVTSVLAGIRRGIEEIHSVLGERKRIFDVSILPRLKLSAEADRS